IKTAPTVFINGKKVEDPYHFKEYDKLLQSK
ncbi:protein-disulfide isomerase, partial [Staphylococcus epidermidis]